jgi:hydrogenase/urease accessory protein HupE
LLWSLPSFAHEVRPGFLEIRGGQGGRYEVVWKAPMRGDLLLPIRPAFPPECSDLVPPAQQQLPGALLERRSLACGEAGLAGKEIRIEGLAATLTDVLVRVLHDDGRTQTKLVQPHAPSVLVGGTQSWLQLTETYTRLGIEHILLGIDHLLFVLGLLLVVADRWMLLKTVTSFTVAHSITLAVATLGYASAPLPPLNVAIALSILFLGPEIVRTWRGQSSLTIRHPWVVAFAFGLLHGFGFASGLSTLGLPRAEIPLALLLFNVGVELGQIGFVLLVLALERSFRILQVRWPQWAELAPGYAVGSLGAYWTVQRAFLMFTEG